METLLTAREVADLLRFKHRSLTDKRVLERLGLRPVKIGHALRFRRKDVERLIEGSMMARARARRGGQSEDGEGEGTRDEGRGPRQGSDSGGER